MNKIVIEMHKASYGDCFLVKCIDEEIQVNMVIDMGLAYYESMGKSLMDLSKEGQLIDLMVFTHIDRDHILGGIEFIRVNGNNEGGSVIKVNEVWHNTYRHMSLEQDGDYKLSSQDREILQSIIRKGIPVPIGSDKRRNKEISVMDGTALGALLLMGGYPWNEQFGGQAVCSGNGPEKGIYLKEKVKIRLLSPTKENLYEIGNWWLDMLVTHKDFKGKLTKDRVFDDAFEFILGQAYEKRVRERYKLISKDEEWLHQGEFHEEIHVSPVNRSSIAFMLEFYDKKILFTGDADPKIIAGSLKKEYGLSEDTKLKIDAIKVPHHGSRHNLSYELLQILDCPRYIISTNGNIYHHPDDETISKIVTTQTSHVKELIFNYDEIAKRYKNELYQKMYHYSISEVSEEVQIIEI